MSELSARVFATLFDFQRFSKLERKGGEECRKLEDKGEGEICVDKYRHFHSIFKLLSRGAIN
jgi:hypothetical protein